MASSTAYVPPTSATASGTSGDQPRTIAAHEGEERDDRDARPRLLEGAVSARERNRGDREEADDAADRGDYARAAGRA